MHVEKNGARLDANRLLERRKPISRSAFGLTLLMREPSIISFASIDQEYRDGGSGGGGGIRPPRPPPHRFWQNSAAGQRRGAALLLAHPDFQTLRHPCE